MITYALLVLAACVCAYRMARAASLLSVNLWLAATSALIAALVYALGAPEVAVIELSVGAGLVTVLFVFAFSVIGELTLDARSMVPRWLAGALALAAVALLGWFLLPLGDPAPAVAGASFGETLWQARGLDVLVQVVLIFSGVLGVLGLLAEEAPLRPLEQRAVLRAAEQAATEQAAAEQAAPADAEASSESLPEAQA